MRLLKDIAEIQIGYQSGSRVKGVEDGPFRIIQASDITTDLRVSTKSMLRFTPERDPERYLVDPNDVIFMSRGHRNYALRTTEELPYTVAANYFFILRPNEGIDPGFLAWTINQPRVQQKIADKVTGTTMPYVRRGDFEAIAIEIPPLKIQTQIVELEEMRAKEEQLLNQLIDARRRFLSAASQQILTNRG